MNCKFVILTNPEEEIDLLYESEIEKTFKSIYSEELQPSFTTLGIPQDIAKSLCWWEPSELEIIRSYHKQFIQKLLDDVGLYKVLNGIVFEYFNFKLCKCCGISSVVKQWDECDKCLDEGCVVNGVIPLECSDFYTKFFNNTIY